MTKETALNKQIMEYCGSMGWMCFHANVFSGKIWDDKQNVERYVKSGFPTGWPDLLILTNDGNVMFCEAKVKPNRPSKRQIEIIELLKKRGFKAFIAYDLNDFIENAKKY